MNDFIPLEEILKTPAHRFYRVYYLRDMYGGWKMAKEEFWSKPAAEAKLERMRKSKRYQAVRLSYVNEVIIE